MFENPAANAVAYTFAAIAVIAGVAWFVLHRRSTPYRKVHPPAYKSTTGASIVDPGVLRNAQLGGYGAPVPPKKNTANTWEHDFLNPANPLSPLNPFNPASPLNQGYELANGGQAHHGHHSSSHDQISGSYDSGGNHDSGFSDSGSGGSCD